MDCTEERREANKVLLLLHMIFHSSRVSTQVHGFSVTRLTQCHAFQLSRPGRRRENANELNQVDRRGHVRRYFSNRIGMR